MVISSSAKVEASPVKIEDDCGSSDSARGSEDDAAADNDEDKRFFDAGPPE